MSLTIQPQDRTQPEKLELELHPALIQRLKSYANSLNGSDVNYVASQIFEQVLPPAKAAKNGDRRQAQKPAKENAKKQTA